MKKEKKLLMISIFILIALFLTPKVLFAKEEEMVKKALVAGSFYPASNEELNKTIDLFFGLVPIQDIKPDILALISPHAGYEYSGQVAAFGYKLISSRKYKTVIIIAPSHRELFKGASIWNSGEFQTPLGNIEVDKDLADKIISKNAKMIRFYPKAFSQEHSLEVQLPFLQKALSNFKIVPIVVGEFSYSICEILSNAIADSIADRTDVLIVASTDLSHYHTYDEANRIDAQTISHIEKFDINGLFDGLISGTSEMCGGMPVIITMMASKKLGADNVAILKYANSGDVTRDHSRVVGYLSAVICKSGSSENKESVSKEEGGNSMLNDGQKKRLLQIARESIENYVKNNKRQSLDEKDPALLRRQGAFVTIKKGDQLRGCIGHIQPTWPLYQTVADMAIEAACGDPRFVHVIPSELKEITLEISVLSPIEEINDVNKIKVGLHGIIIRKGPYSGLLLPQVATEYGWDRDEFLKHSCLKAGLPADAWKKGAEIYIFSADVFGEEDFKKP